MSGDLTKDVREDGRNGCESIWPYLSIYADREANDYETILVESHLKQCSKCEEELTWLRTATQMIVETAEVVPPAHLRASILAATVNRESFIDRLFNALRPVAVLRPARIAAAAVAGVLIATAVAVERYGNVTVPAVSHEVSSPAGVAAKATEPTNPTVSPSLPMTVPTVATPIRTATRPDHKVVRAEIARATVAADPSAVAHKSASIKNPIVTPSVVRRLVSKPPTFKAKPAEGDAIAEDPTPLVPETKEPANVPVTGGMVTADMKTPVVGPAEVESPVRAPTVSRIQISASSTEIPSDQTVTLAGLKQALRQQSMGWNMGEARQNLKDKQIRIDLLKRSF